MDAEQQEATREWQRNNPETTRRLRKVSYTLGDLQARVMDAILDQMEELPDVNDYRVLEFIDTVGQRLNSLSALTGAINHFGGDYGP